MNYTKPYISRFAESVASHTRSLPNGLPLIIEGSMTEVDSDIHARMFKFRADLFHGEKLIESYAPGVRYIHYHDEPLLKEDVEGYLKGSISEVEEAVREALGEDMEKRFDLVNANSLILIIRKRA